LTGGRPDLDAPDLDAPDPADRPDLGRVVGEPAATGPVVTRGEPARAGCPAPLHEVITSAAPASAAGSGTRRRVTGSGRRAQQPR